MAILITYDVSQRQPEVKTEMIRNGFFDNWTDNNQTYYLPNTTLWHPNLQTPGEATEIFKEVISQLNRNQPLNRIIKIERLIAVEFNAYSGEPGDPHAK